MIPEDRLLTDAQVDAELGLWRDLRLSPHPDGPAAEAIRRVQPKGPSKIAFAAGLAVHSVLFVASRVTVAVGAHQLALVVARARISLDDLWYEPLACGLNSALTDLGLAMLNRGNADEAARCLTASAQVHPCPHSLSFGLRTSLADALSTRGGFSEAVQRYRSRRAKFRDA
jgi:hypothetical protein